MIERFWSVSTWDMDECRFKLRRDSLCTPKMPLKNSICEMRHSGQCGDKRALKEGNIMTTAFDRPTRFTDDVRLTYLERAKTLLRQSTIPAKEACDLAEALKDCNEFGYARKLFGRVRAARDYTDLENKRVKIGQRHALCTYKDTDLAVADRFNRALEILDEVDQLECVPAQRQESLGLRGAVYKRMWQVEGQ